ncbi:MAG: UvrD-helicase domain-containing protein, partial [Firmicutes bacterium]|nr:UvrD-helicase domain-containing protein [Bacillota bacterium]
MGILDGLNPRQLEAVKHVEGPLLVLAGAGSGKTRVLTRRIASLIAHAGVAPWNILAVTFTNKAAAEMRERVEDLLGGRSQGMWVTTFHSACVRILRTDGERVGIRRNFVIYDTPDQQAVAKECLKELNLDPKNFDPRAMLDAIGKAKNELTSVEDYEAVAGDYWEKTVARVYRLYQARLRANNAVDFDDLIMETVNLFRQNEQVLDAYQERFRYILIDEYQDTNHAQYQLVKLLAAKYRNICVVGDEDQSIYGWRGADIRNILDFTGDYPECTVIKLEQNYRSTQRILDAANGVITNNRDRLEKSLWTDGPPGEKIALYRAFDDRDEANFITGEIRRLAKAEKRPFADFALLYRTNAQSRVFEEAFMNVGLPYKVVGTLRFYERKEIKDLLAYLRVIYDPDDSVSLRRIINVPRRGIGTATMTRLDDFAQSQGLTLSAALQRADEIEGISARFAGVLASLAVFLQSFTAMALELPV